MLATTVGPNHTSLADAVEAMLEIRAEHVILWIGLWVRPNRTKAPNQPCDPIGSLDGLIAMTFQVEGRFDQMPKRVSSIHTLRCSGKQGRPAFVLVEGQKKVIWRVTVFSTKVVDPLNCSEQNAFVKPIWLVVIGAGGFLDSNVQHETAKFFDLVEQTVCRYSKLAILDDVSCRVETGPLFLP